MNKLIKAIQNNEVISLQKYIDHLEEFATSEVAAKNGEISFFVKLCLEKKQLKIFHKLVELGVPLDGAVHFDAATLLNYAVCCKMKSEIADKMLIHSDVYAVNENYETPMHVAVKSKNYKLLDKLLDYCMKNTKEHCNMVDNDGLSLLHILCIRGNSNYVKRFLDDVPSSDINDTVWLESKFYPGYSTTHFAATFYRHEVLKILIKSGAYLNTKTPQGLTMLHILCKVDKDHWIGAEVTKKILSYRVSYRKTDITDDKTRLIVQQKAKQACSAYVDKVFENRVKSVKLLLDNRCKVDAVDKKGNHILTYLTSNSHVNISRSHNERCMHFLTETITAKLKISQLKIARLLRNADAINLASLESAKAGNADTTLHRLVASANPDIELLEIFLRFRPNVNAIDFYNATPLHIATERGNLGIIRTLLEFGYNNVCDEMVNVNALDSFGNSPLRSILYQVKKRSRTINAATQYACFKTLLDYGTDIHLENERGDSILSLANDYILRKDAERSSRAKGSCVQVGEVISRKIIKLIYDNLVKSRQYGCYKTELYNQFMNISAKPLTQLERLERVNHQRAQLIDRRLDVIRAAQHPQDFQFVNLFDFARDDDPFERASQQVAILQSKCAAEIEKMKITKINNFVTLDKILTRSINTVVSYTRNAALKRILTSPDFHSEFPEYGFMLKARVARALARSKLLDEAKASLQFLMRPDIPKSCVMEILNYLSENKLRDIIEVKRSSWYCRMLPN